MHFNHIDESVINLFKRSLLTVRAHVDKGGAIIASSDSSILNQGRDTYSYTWPRDAGFSTIALVVAGDFHSARNFFSFCEKIISKEGYFMHKYLPDGSVGSSWHPWMHDGESILPIQEDETGIILIALRRYYELSHDVEFIEKVFNTLIVPAADFMVRYRNITTHLPLPSYDLWEEKYGVHTYSTSVVHSALESAQYFSELLGKYSLAQKYKTASAEIKTALLSELYNVESASFYKSIYSDKEGVVHHDTTLDMSNIFGIYKFGILPPEDKRVVAGIEKIKNELMLSEDTVGGIPRYTEDGYYRVSNELPPNPWFITTLWLAQYYILVAKTHTDLEKAHDILKWVASHTTASGILSEQIHPHTGESIGATPLAWSHAEFVITTIEYLQKLEDLGICKTCYPLKRPEQKPASSKKWWFEIK